VEKADQRETSLSAVLFQGMAATCVFELTRNFSPQRLLVAGVLALFPPAMMFLILIGPRLVGATSFVTVPVFLILVLVGIVCFLSLLLWSSTVVDSDLEGRTWVYLASRPMGRTSSFLGKYLAALIQCWGVCAIAIMGSFLVAKLAGAVEGSAFRQMLAMMAVFGVAAIVYNSVLSFLGVLFFRRAMIACVAWALASELFIAFIPAVVRFMTVRYHIQELVFRWVGWLFPDVEGELIYRDLFGDFGIWLHLSVLGLITALALTAALWRINHHEYLSAEES
jgi:ABC-type transport system involved in multi-copper enzyme maturation permease subunit